MAVTLDGLHPTLMRPRVEALLNDPEARALRLYVVSAFRSVARQAVLFAAAVVKYGSVAKARRWVAPPGNSNHGPRLEWEFADGGDGKKYGAAVDLGLPGVKAVSGHWPLGVRNRVDDLAARYGLYSPMAWEDWHYEPILTWRPPHSTTGSTPREDLLLMAIAKNDDDARRAWARQQCLNYWGREPAVDHLDYYADEIAERGADAVLGEIFDHSFAREFRQRRGW